jgi:di/tricarboxylate transporter
LTLAVAYVLALLVLALFLFAKDFLPLDVTALIVLLLLVLPPGILTPAEALAGFGSETIMILVALFVLTAGVTRTGVVERIGMRVAALGRERPVLLTRMLLAACTTISSFLSNTVTTAVFVPLMIGSARRARIPVGKTLMPLAFASILSGGITVISTSTNLVVSGELVRYGLEPIGFFEMAPAGLVITVAGMLYLLLVAPRLIPDRTGVDVIERYNLRKYISEVEVTPGSSLAGKSLGESKLEAMDLIVLGIRRSETKILAPRRSTLLREGDVLLVEGRAEDILSVKDAAGIVIRPDFKLSDPDLVSENVRMVEAMVLPRSNLIGRTLSEALFRERTGLTVLAIHSGETTTRIALSKRRLEAGDVLLLQGGVENLETIDDQDLVLLEDKSAHHPRTAKSRIALIVFVACIALAASGALPMAIAFLVGVPVLILARCLSTEEAYESVDWRLMVMIGSMMAFGVAMQKTGAAAWLAGLIVEHVSGLGTHAMLTGFFALTVLLTQPMSNQAAALVLLPVAIQVSDTMGIDPRPLVMCVTFAASCSFMTPLEPSCILVYGPGRYRFLDFVRVGGILTAIVFVASILLIPIFWPMEPAGP